MLPLRQVTHSALCSAPVSLAASCSPLLSIYFTDSFLFCFCLSVFLSFCLFLSFLQAQLPRRLRTHPRPAPRQPPRYVDFDISPSAWGPPRLVRPPRSPPPIATKRPTTLGASLSGFLFFLGGVPPHRLPRDAATPAIVPPCAPYCVALSFVHRGFFCFPIM